MNEDTQDIDNIDYIRRLNRIMLQEAEVAITKDLPGDNKVPPAPVIATEGGDTQIPPLPPQSSDEMIDTVKRRNILKRRNRMYGFRNPIVWVLEKIADTELKIEKQRPAAAANKEPEKSPPLNEREMELLRTLMEEEGE